MSKQFTQEEQIAAVIEAVRNINIDTAEHGAPVHSHEEILSFKRITHLRRLGKMMRVKYYGKLSKPDLIRGIVESMKDPRMLKLFLEELDKPGWEFFQNTKAQHENGVDYLFLDFYIAAQHLGLIQSFYHEDRLIFVVPDEIKKTFQALEASGFIEDMDYQHDLLDFAIAAVNLYGVIHQLDFVALFNSYHERQTTVSEVFNILIGHVYREVGFDFWDNYIVDDEFKEDDYISVKDLVEERQGKPRYDPPYEEFIKYADWAYYEFTPQLEALERYLSEWVDDPDEVMDLLDEIHDYCMAEADPREYFELLTASGAVFDGIDQVKKALQLIVEVQNSTRLWRNYGHTPNELVKTAPRSKILQFPSGREAPAGKTGRNDPCPCGSGKKYKNCCGKTT